MTAFDLLDAVLPKGGWYNLLALRNGERVQDFFKSKKDLSEAVRRLLPKGYDIYFGLAKYATDHNRKKANVQALQSFWLDLDVGADKAAAGKGYLTQKDALAALINFTNKTNLPRPIVVNSGYGIHAYWPLTHPVSREEWEPVAARLRDLCYAHGVKVDRVVFEVARVLRLPDTYNFKKAAPALVSVMAPANPTDFAQICKLVGVDKPVVIPPSKTVTSPSGRPQTALGASLTKSPDAEFKKILFRKDGCLQLRSAMQGRKTLEEPLWFAALSVANKCIDRTQAIKAVSEEHPGYQWGDAEAKAARTAGPSSCQHFDNLNPGVCGACPHFGEIKSPIVLGSDQIAPPQAKEAVVETTNAGVISYRIPPYPKGYQRPDDGGVERMVKEKDGTTYPVEVFPYDLHVIRRMTDPDEGQCYIIRLVQPHDGITEFVMSAMKLVDKAECRRFLAKNAVATQDKVFPYLYDYLVCAARDLQNRRKAEVMHNQLGWTKDRKKFVLGETEYHLGGGEAHSPASAATKEQAQHMHPKGDLKIWKEIFSLYNRPGLEPHMFAVLSAFGSPLLNFTGQSGAAINVIHPHSGTGKTTIINMTNSVYGDPKGMSAVSNDTAFARVHKMGVYNSICYCIDEITNTSAAAASELLYGNTNGKGRDRMEANSNKLRPNSTTWALIGLYSSNASMYERLSIKKASPEGEMMRLIEYKIEHSSAIDPAEAKAAFDDALPKNYGLAGIVYIRHIMRNSARVIALLKNVQQKIDAELKLHPRERHWSAVIASNIVGGMMARECGLIDWDMAAIYRWCAILIKELRKDTAQPLLEGDSVLGEYLNTFTPNTLVVSLTKGFNKPPELMVDTPPKGPLYIRYEAHTDRLFLTVKHFKDFCVERDINYKETLRLLEKEGALISREAKRLATGLSSISSPVRCLVLDTTSSTFSGVALPQTQALSIAIEEDAEA